MSQVFLLSARMHPNTATGYETFGIDNGPRRQGVRVIYSSRSGEDIDRTELAVCFLAQDGDRNADFMREASFTGFLAPQNIFKAANILHKVTDGNIQELGDLPKAIKKALNFSEDSCDSGPAPDESEDFRQALRLAAEKGCVYCDPGTKGIALKRTESALILLPPHEWFWSEDKQCYQFSVFFDCDSPDEPLQSEDTCTLVFSETECPTVGPIWRFDESGRLISGSLPEPVQEQQPEEPISAPVVHQQRSDRHADGAPFQPKFSRLLRWISVIVLIAVATAALALASTIHGTDKAIYLRISLSSAKPILFAIYGFVVGLLVGRRH